MWRGVLLWAVLASGCASGGVPAPSVLQVPHDGMVYVPSGPFIMGHDASDGLLGLEVGIDSMPARKVTLPGYWIDRTEVTVGDYFGFIQATGGRSFPAWAFAWPLDRQGVAVGIDFAGAKAYCAWAGKQLPTEAEWEKAARGTDGRIYPWGNRWQPELVVFHERSVLHPLRPGMRPGNASPYGALDMAGNVMEWTDSWYDAPPGSTLQRQAFGQQFRVLKGGSWETQPLFLRAANRFAVLPVLGQPSFGFRCVAR